MSDAIKARRLQAEIKNFTTDFDMDGIAYIHHDDNEGYGLIRGMQETPYEGGFYIIKFQFSDKYPFTPPSCTHISISGQRQSPNFHDKKGAHEGIVCLSRLNTWDSDDGDCWTARLGIAYVLTMIRTQVLTAVPLDREPNYRHSIENPSNARNYEYFVTYHNYRSNVVDIYRRLVNGQTSIPIKIEEQFSKIIYDYVNKHRQNYMLRLTCLSSIHHGRCYNCSTYANSSCFCDYEELIADFQQHYGIVDKIIVRIKEKVD